MAKRRRYHVWEPSGKKCQECGGFMPKPTILTPRPPCWECWRAVPDDVRFSPEAGPTERAYRISAPHAVTLWTAAGRVCACCGNTAKRNEWRIDHVDTLTRPVVRGIICNGCNAVTLGKNGDTPAGLYQARNGADDWGELYPVEQALEYLEKTRKAVLIANGGKPGKPGKGRVYGGNGYPFKWVVGPEGRMAGFKPSWAYQFKCDRDGRPLGKIYPPIQPPR